MGGRRSPADVLKDEGPQAFSFLVEEYGFTGPALGEWGIGYQLGGLEIDVTAWRVLGDTSFWTMLYENFDDFTASCRLDRLYVTCGLGPEQDVPDDVGGVRVVRERIAQHSAALRKLMPQLTGPWRAQLLRRCTGPDA